MFLFCFVFRFCFVFLSVEHIRIVLCLQKVLGRSWWSSRSRWSVGLLVLFAHLFICDSLFFFPSFLNWVTLLWYFPSRSVGFQCFLTRKDCVNVSCWEEVTPEPFDHVVMSCCLPGGGKKKRKKKKKVLFVDRSGVVNSVLKLLLQVCVEGREGFKKCFVLSFYCSTMFLFSLLKVMVAVSHFSLWSSLLKKVLLVATQSCWVCVRVMFCVWTFTGLLHKTYHNMGTVWSAEFAE